MIQYLYSTLCLKWYRKLNMLINEEAKLRSLRTAPQNKFVAFKYLKHMKRHQGLINKMWTLCCPQLLVVLIMESCIKVVWWYLHLLSELEYPTLKWQICIQRQEIFKEDYWCCDSTPMETSYHIAIVYFAIQNWKQDGSINHSKICAWNPSDDIYTKPLLGWIH